MTVARRFNALRYAAVTATLLAASAAHGKAAAPPFLETAGVIDAPHGFVEMCKSDSSFCAPTRTRTDQGNTHDAVEQDPLPMSAPPLFMVSVPFYVDAPFPRPVIGTASLGALSDGVHMARVQTGYLPGTAIAIGRFALASCASLSGDFGANDGALS